MASHIEKRPPDLTIEINLTLSDTTKPLFTAMGSTKWIAAFLITCIVLSSLHSILQRPTLTEILPYALVLLILIAVFYSIKRNYDKLPDHQKSVRFTFCDEHIESVTEKHSSISQWNAITRALESKSHFLLWLNEQQAFVIPKREMNPRQMSTLQEWIQYKDISQKAPKKLVTAKRLFILWIVLILVFVLFYNWIGTD